jgi:hypothetical protein
MLEVVDGVVQVESLHRLFPLRDLAAATVFTRHREVAEHDGTDMRLHVVELLQGLSTGSTLGMKAGATKPICNGVLAVHLTEVVNAGRWVRDLEVCAFTLVWTGQWKLCGALLFLVDLHLELVLDGESSDFICVGEMHSFM